MLKYKKTILRNSEPYRFCNIPNNAVVELVPTSHLANTKVAAAVGSSAKPCRIALAVEGGITMNAELMPELSLYHVLVHFIAEGLLAQEVLMLTPEVIYLRTRHCGDEALRSATLASLGLGGYGLP